MNIKSRNFESIEIQDFYYEAEIKITLARGSFLVGFDWWPAAIFLP
ncbi:hypothetical protein [Candidatus Lokiarchaeum ossiferum]